MGWRRPGDPLRPDVPNPRFMSGTRCVRARPKTQRIGPLAPAFLAVCMLVSLVTPASAIEAVPELAPHFAALPGLQRNIAMIERTRALIGTDGLAGAVEAVAENSGVSLLDGPSTGASHDADSLAPTLAQPVGELLTAIDSADRVVAQAGPSHITFLKHEPISASQPLNASHITDQVMGSLIGRHRHGGMSSSSAIHTLSAGYIIASAIDDALPRLQALAHDVEGTGPAACDVLDQLPRLCIGGSDKNVYSEDAELLIDLGGDDLYKNSAGGANAETGNGLSESVVIDVGGKDRYQAVLPQSNGNRVVQGAGADNGVGFLVDGAGNDTYTVIDKPKLTAPDSLGAVGQGAAMGGFGMLADLGGNDSYRITSIGPGGTQGAYGQGLGSSGAGILIDGAGDDAYQLVSRPTPLEDQNKFPHPRGASAVGMGAALQGAGLLFDGGGADTTKLLAASVVDRKYASATLEAAGAVAEGLGAGVVGVGMALFGDGKTRHSVLADTRIPTYDREAGPGSLGLAMGAGLEGAGIIDDLGGDDSYKIDATARGSELGLGFTVGMGAGNTGAGLVRDLGGNDRYSANAFAEEQGTGIAITIAQGAALAGGGFLEDLQGDDVYDAVAKAITINPVQLEGLGALGYAQGASLQGAAGLLDGGGKDKYTTKNVYMIGGTNTSLSNAASSAQASVDTGVALFFDLNDSGGDKFVVFPDDAACSGKRGKEEWKDCGQVYGYGRNPNA